MNVASFIERVPGRVGNAQLAAQLREVQQLAWSGSYALQHADQQLTGKGPLIGERFVGALESLTRADTMLQQAWAHSGGPSGPLADVEAHLRRIGSAAHDAAETVRAAPVVAGSTTLQFERSAADDALRAVHEARRQAYRLDEILDERVQDATPVRDSLRLTTLGKMTAGGVVAGGVVGGGSAVAATVLAPDE